MQALAAFMNILLPCQRVPAIKSSRTANPESNGARSPGFPHPYSSSSSRTQAASPSAEPTFPSPDPPSTSLFPYLRRLVVTGLDFPGVLHGFFGDDWAAGIGPLHEQERRNLLFAAKSSGWMGVKKDYDLGWAETVPFLRPLQQAVEPEVTAAERSWSEWLAMEDWMVGPRAPADGQETRMTGTERVGEGFS